MKKIAHIASIIMHNKEAEENLRVKLSTLWQQKKQDSPEYKRLRQMHERAKNNVDKFTDELFELGARLLPSGRIEVYKQQHQKEQEKQKPQLELF